MPDAAPPGPAAGGPATARAAAALRVDAARIRAALRLRPAEAGNPALDRISALAAQLLGARSAQVNLLDEVLLVAGAAGDAEATVGTEMPVEESFCSLAVAQRAPLVIGDAATDERVRELHWVTGGRIGAYLGAPLAGPDGQTVGTLCVFDPLPRDWTDADAGLLAQLAASAATELELDALAREYEQVRLGWRLAMDAGGVGAFDWDLRTGELSWDERLITMFGYTPETFTATIDAFSARLHPGDLARVTEALQGAVESRGVLDVEYRIILPSGEIRWAHSRGRTVSDADGAPLRFLGSAYDTTERRARDVRVTRVLEAMPAGFYSLDPDWRFTYVNAEAERLLSHSRDDLLGELLWDAFPATVGSVFEERYRTAVRTGRPATFDAYYPPPLDGWFELRAWPSPEGLSVYFTEVTERRNVQARAERAAQRLALLAQVSAELSGTLDVQGATGHLPRLVVPALAEWCIVTLVDDDGRLRDAGHWHADPDRRDLVARYAGNRLDAMPATAPVPRALLSGEPVHAAGQEVLALLSPGTAHDALAELAPERGVVLPMRARGRTLGVLTLFFRPGWTPRQEDLATAQDVADRAGLALDNARLYRQQQQLAEGLQRSLLTEPPEPDHAQIAVRYLPAAEAARVGGDWYDAFLQSSGATVLVIGDVVGHDTEAAAAMGHLRGLLRGIATYSDAAPAEVLRGLDASMAVLGTDVLATAAVARLEQTDDELRRGLTRLRWANAGHLPPLVLRPDGSVGEPASWLGDLLLGVDSGTARREYELVLERGSTVLLYTDGLVERRDSDLDAGIRRLRETLAELAHLPLEQLLDEVLERLVDGRPEDDVALVAVRLHRQDRPRPAEAGPNRVSAVVPDDPATA
ncbi:SpoIIE family protein phosphatase [Blastococcus sp. SYSU D00695]